MQISEGEIVTENNSRSTIGITSDKIPFIERISLNSELILSDNKATNYISGINRTRETNFLVLYNSYFGNNTSTNQYGTEISIAPISQKLVNDTIKYVVTEKLINQGSMGISTSNSVLSGHGTSKDFIDANIKVGDTISILHKISPAPLNVNSLLTGFTKIVRDGTNCALDCYAEEGGSSTFASARHPRTAVGFSEDKKFLYFVTVDGRQESSVGMSLPELSDFMISLGVYRAVNLDGGGSTTMVVRNSVANSPSDAGGERSVANSLMVVSQDQTGELSQINLNSEYAKVFSNKTYQFHTTGIDDFFNSVSFNSSDVNYYLSKNIGQINNDGLFTAGLNADSGYVIAEYGNMLDSALVIVNSIVKLKLTPDIVLLDTNKTIQFEVESFDVNGWDRRLSNDNFTWYSTNDNVGVVDSLGNFTGISEGSTKVIVQWGEIKDTAIVSIELNEGTMLLNSFQNLTNLNLTSKNIDSLNSSIEIDTTSYTEGNSSLVLNYNFTYDSGVQYWAYINTNIPIQGIPHDFQIDVNASDYKHTIAFIVTNNSGDEFAILTDKFADLDESFDTLTADFTNPIPLGTNTNFYFPIELKSIAIFLNSDKIKDEQYEGKILFDNLRLNYSEIPLSVKHSENIPTKIWLSQNFPNPFNPSTIIKFKIPSNKSLELVKVKLEVFDILGRRISTLIDEFKSPGTYETIFDAKSLASGVYYYSLSADNFFETKKMLLLR